MSQLIGVGVTLSGVVDRDSGVVRHSGALGWADVSFQALLEEALGEAVVLDSYANAYTRGLLFDGSLTVSELLVFSVGMSLGAAVVVEGRIQPGFNGSAGGFAHSRAITGTDPVRMCHCGAEDCLETRGSLRGFGTKSSGSAEASGSLIPSWTTKSFPRRPGIWGSAWRTWPRSLARKRWSWDSLRSASLGGSPNKPGSRSFGIRTFEYSGTRTGNHRHGSCCLGARRGMLRAGRVFTARESQERSA